MPKKFETKIRVRLSETDALGVVYYGQYFTYFDVARLEMLRAAGITLGYLNRKGLGFVAVESGCRYFSSAKFDDALTASVSVAKIGTSSVTYSHIVSNGRRKIAEGTVSDVLVGRDKKPTRIPEEVRRMLSRYAS